MLKVANVSIANQTIPGRFSRQTVWRFLTIFFPIVLSIFIFGAIIFLIESTNRKTIISSSQIQNVTLQKQVISYNLKSVISDMRILAAHHEFQTYFSDKSPETLEHLAVEFRSFAQSKSVYDQVRFLDIDGNELIRINKNEGEYTIISFETMQNKGKRYYFLDTLHLDRDQIYISPFDLNIENGEIEWPYKPMIRFGTPIYNSTGEKQGIIVLNYLGGKLLNEFTQNSSSGAFIPMLVNSDGYWLKGPSPDLEWTFMFSGRESITFNRKYPGLWNEIENNDDGQLSVGAGLFTFTTVYPASGELSTGSGSKNPNQPSDWQSSAEKYHWKIVSYVSREELTREQRKILKKYLAIYIFISLIAGAGSGAIALESAARRKSERELKLLNTGIEQIRESIIIVSEKLTIEYVNPAFEMREGKQKNEIIGMQFMDCMDGSEVALPTGDIIHSAVMNEIWNGEAIHKRVDGEERFELLTVTPFGPLVKGGRAFVCIFLDITDHRKLEDKINSLRYDNEIIMRHEIKNLFGPISGFSQLLLMDESLTLSSRQTLYLNRIKESVDIASNFIDKLKILHDIELGYYELSREAVSIDQVLEKVIIDLKMLASENDVRIFFDTEGKSEQVMVDPDLMPGVFHNLVKNAIEHVASLNDPLEKTVLIKRSNVDGNSNIIINNRGEIISEERLQVIFDKFNTDRMKKKEGTGLGTTYALLVTKAHEGNIRIDSDMINGTTVTVTLPNLTRGRHS